MSPQSLRRKLRNTREYPREILKRGLLEEPEAPWNSSDFGWRFLPGRSHSRQDLIRRALTLEAVRQSASELLQNPTKFTSESTDSRVVVMSKCITRAKTLPNRNMKCRFWISTDNRRTAQPAIQKGAACVNPSRFQSPWSTGTALHERPTMSPGLINLIRRSFQFVHEIVRTARATVGPMKGSVTYSFVCLSVSVTVHRFTIVSHNWSELCCARFVPKRRDFTLFPTVMSGDFAGGQSEIVLN